MKIEIRHNTGWQPLGEATLRGTLSPQVYRLYLPPGALGGDIQYIGIQLSVRVDGVESLAASELTELRGKTMTVLMVVMPAPHTLRHDAVAWGG